MLWYCDCVTESLYSHLHAELQSWILGHSFQQVMTANMAKKVHCVLRNEPRVIE